MNRIERLSAILIQLQTKKVITSGELCKYFDVSQRTIYRDIRSLEESGVPIGAEAGVGYFLADGYQLPPVMFTKEEASGLILGYKLVEKYADKDLLSQYFSAISKVKAVLKTIDKEYVEGLEDQISIHPFYHGRAHSTIANDYLSKIHLALPDHQVISIKYFSNHSREINNREVEPIGLCYYAENWHLIAFCTLRKSYRDFRIDRIHGLELTQKYFNPQLHINLSEYLDNQKQTTNLTEVILRFDNDVIKYIESSKYYFGYVKCVQCEKFTDMVFHVTTLEYLSRWILMFDKSVKIIQPVALVQQMKAILKKVSEHVKKSY